MAQATFKQQFPIWFLILACLVAAALSWWWFAQRIERIETQIEQHEQH